MQQFTLLLKDNTQKAFNSFFWFLFFLHLVTASVIVIKTTNDLQRTYAAGAIAIFVLFTALAVAIKEKLKWFSYQLLIFITMIFFWPLQSAWLPAVMVTAVIIFSLIVRKTTSAALFTGTNIIVTKSLFKKKYGWAEVDYVILKDQLLSINLKNNQLLQVEISPESYGINETSFNQFCRLQITPDP